MTMQLARSAWVLLVFTLIAACSGSDSKNGRLLGADPAPAPEETDRINKMMAVRMISTGNGGPEGVIVDFAGITDEVFEYCNGAVEQGSCQSTSAGCEEDVCLQRLLTCMAETFVAVAKDEATSIELFVAGQGYKFLPQTTPAKAGLSAEALEHAFAAAAVVSELMPSSLPTSCWSQRATHGAQIDELARGSVQGFYLMKEARDLLVDAVLAVSDAERSSTPSRTLAGARAEAQARLSRAAVAHYLLGGEPGLRGSQTAGFCDVGPLGGPAQAALKIFRESGVSPAALLNNAIDTNTLLNGVATDVPDGSVRQRLFNRWGVTQPTGPSDPKLETYYRLKREDFEHARQYLIQEIKAFSRSLTAKLPETPAPTYPLFAATAMPPPDRDASYFTAITSTDCGDSYCTCTEASCSSTALGANGPPPVPVPPLGGTKEGYRWRSASVPFPTIGLGGVNEDIATKLDIVLTEVDALLRTPALQAEPAYSAVFGTLQRISEHAKDRPARLVHCTGGAAPTFKLNGFGTSPPALMIRGEDALECYTKGSIEGAACTSAMIPDTFLGEFSQSATPDAGFEAASQIPFPSAALLTPSAPQRWYVIVRRPGTTGQLGEWSALVGFVPYRHSSSAHMCRDIPIVPSLHEVVKKALAPDREQCAASQEHCSGVSFDERLPLEDELSSDADDIESSWKRYLDLADQAAKESDLLGQEYVRAALESERNQLDVELRQQGQAEKAAAKLGELQEICGTAVDPAPLIAEIGKIAAEKKPTTSVTSDLSNFSVADLDVGPCPTSDDNDSRTICVAGRNTIDLDHVLTPAYLGNHPAVENAGELAKLRQCLQKLSDTGGRVHLGTVPVCIWPGGDGNMCSDKPEGQMCPDVAGDDGACPNGGTPVADGLGFFDTNAALPAAPSLTMCGAIRALRTNPSDSIGLQKLQELVSNNGFSRELLQSPYITFEARYLTHGAILVGEAPQNAQTVLWSTGTPESGPQTGSWPCNDDDIAGNCPTGGTGCSSSGSAGLFCAACDCTNDVQRGEIVQRMVNAVAAAQLTRVHAGGRVPRMKLPGYVSDGVFSSATGSSAKLRERGGKTVRNTGSDLAPVREHLISHNGLIFSPFPMNGAAYTTTVALGGFGRRAFVLPNNVVKDVCGGASCETTNVRFAVVDGAIGAFTLNPAAVVDRSKITIAIVPYDPIATFFAGLATDGTADGYFASVLRGERNHGATNVPPGYTVALPTQANVEFLSSVVPNSAAIPFDSFVQPFNFDFNSLMDGLELLCEAKSNENSFNAASCGDEPPQISNIGGLPNVSRYLNCVGRTVQRRGALTVFENFPPEARDPLRKDSPVGTHAAVSGALGKQYSDLRNAFWDIADAGPGIGRELSGLARDIDDLRTTAAINENNKDLANLQFWSTVAQQTAECADAATTPGDTIQSAGAHAAIRCANAVAQIHFASEINRISQTNDDLRTKLAQNEFHERFSHRISALEGFAIRLGKATETVDGLLIEVQNTRSRARRTLGEALWLLSQEAKSQAAISNVLASGKATAEARYRKAFQNAKLMAFLAKRAIEQRLGVKLAEMTDNLPLVDAPATWEGTVCARSGIDYEALAGREDPETPLQQQRPVSFAEAFIGDYVQNLKNLVESYRLEYNFHEGTDTAVVSLRDDIQNVRAACDTESKNLLYFSADLARTARVHEPENPRWFLDGCRTTTIDDLTFPLRDCVGVTRDGQNGVDVKPFISAALELRSVPGFTLNFGDGGSCPAATCGWQTGAGLVQQTTLPAGLYRFSWYTPESCSPLPACLTNTTAPGILAGFARTTAGTDLRPPSSDVVNNGLVAGDGTTWNRPYFLFELASATDVKVGFRSTATQAAALVNATVAAPMLELVERSGASVTREPKAFSTTAESRLVTLPLCEDTDGAVFRSTQWHRECVKLCSDGFASDCAGEQAQTACYREAAFNVNQRGIESGGMFVQSGFARGNFNYRIDSIGLNFVGTGIRDCEDEPLATTCHGNGYVTYTLEHQGPYFVRNHFGEDYEAKIFPGTIEHARGLATERYLTNPLGSSDAEVVSGYLRTELRGRPLDGNFILRVWEEPGLRFDAIQDVQILLNYRYWTRSQ
jgi:hypothetical protein